MSEQQAPALDSDLHPVVEVVRRLFFGLAGLALLLVLLLIPAVFTGKLELLGGFALVGNVLVAGWALLALKGYGKSVASPASTLLSSLWFGIGAGMLMAFIGVWTFVLLSVEFAEALK